MKLNKYRLGDFIELYSKRCNISNLTIYQVSGINRDKEFFEPSKQVGEDTSNYKIVPPNYFACNLMHVGRDIVLPISMNHSNNNKYVSPAYSVFKIINEDIILNDYFFMLLKSDEKDRFFWFNTDSSVRDGMSWSDFCSLEVEVPKIEIQKRYVNIYKAMSENQKSYEKGLNDLKLTCDAYIENLRRNNTCFSIRDYISETNERNINLMVNEVQGVNSSSEFGETKADTSGLDFHNYKIVHNNFFAYNPSRINLGSIALRKGDDCIVSPMYCTFRINDEKLLLPEYLMMWFNRKEFQRSTWYYASGSVRDTFNFSSMQEVEIPIPKIEIQKDIVNIYQTYLIRKEINEKLKNKLKEICPILIKGSIEEARLS